MALSNRTKRTCDEKTEHSGNRQRLDKWLWFARVVKSRSLAAKLVCEGHVRVNSQRTDNPAKAVFVGDVLTIALERDVRVLKVRSPGLRRGPYPEACQLFEDLTARTTRGSEAGPSRVSEAEPADEDNQG